LPSDDGGHGADEECVVCYEKRCLASPHQVFARCGHGALMCGNCAAKLDRCPICREIKEGRETYVLATEALQTHRCHVPTDSDETGSLDLDLPGLEHGSCTAAPMPELPAPSQLEMQALAEKRIADAAEQLADAAAVDEIEKMLRQDIEGGDCENSEVDNGAVMESSASWVARQFGLDLSLPQEVQQLSNRDLSQPQREPLPAPPRKSSSHSKRLRVKSTSKGTVTKASDNPFAKHNVPDQVVEGLPHSEFVQLMKTHGFTAKQVTAGKRFRKRLKNRRQVMQYADKKRVGEGVLREENAVLHGKVAQLQRENHQLRATNEQLARSRDFFEIARATAIRDAEQLQAELTAMHAQLAAARQSTIVD